MKTPSIQALGKIGRTRQVMSIKRNDPYAVSSMLHSIRSRKRVSQYLYGQRPRSGLRTRTPPPSEGTDQTRDLKIATSLPIALFANHRRSADAGRIALEPALGDLDPVQQALRC